jgi:hypothetical protein
LRTRLSHGARSGRDLIRRLNRAGAGHDHEAGPSHQQPSHRDDRVGGTRRAPGKGHEVVDIGDVAVRVGRALAAGDADARALIDTRDRILDAAVVEDQLKRLVTLPEELSPIATS